MDSSFPIIFIIERDVFNNIWKHNPIVYKQVYLWSLFFDSHWTTHQSNIRGPIRKVIDKPSHALCT